MRKPKHTFETVVEELVDGLEAGTITLKERGAEKPTQNGAVPSSQISSASAGMEQPIPEPNFPEKGKT